MVSNRKNQLTLLVAAGLALLSFGLVFWLFSSGLAAPILAGLIGGVVGGMLVRLKFEQREKEVEAKARHQGPTTEERIQELLEQVVKLNARARVAGLDKNVLGRVEELIDLLRKLVPRANKEWPGKSLTWSINQTCEEYLPKVLTEYIDLEEDQRQARKEQMLTRLDQLGEALRDADQMMRDQEESEFTVVDKFLKARLNEGL